MFWRFARGVTRFLKTPLTAGDCERIAAEALQARDDNFLLLLQRAIFDNPKCPYAALLKHAGADYGDIENDVRAEGVEAAVANLYDAGVYLDFEEFKGKKPIERSGLLIQASAEDFDNPLLTRDFEVQSSGSAGARRRMGVDLELLVLESAVRRIYLSEAGLEERPQALWRSVPPGAAGIKRALRAAKCGQPLERWFSPTRSEWTSGQWPSALFLTTAVVAGRLNGGSIPSPEYVELSDPEPVARWVEDKVRKATPPLLSTSASSGVRLAATGRDFTGAVFELGGESITQAKRAVIEASGARIISGYALSETGTLGLACLNKTAIDEVHLFASKVAVCQRQVKAPDGELVRSLLLTTLHPSTPKLLLNVDVGDYGVMPGGNCGCPIEKLGFQHRLHTIRSYEKLTAGGMHFIAGDVLTILEEVLPNRHGGRPGDYQFVEAERDGLSHVMIAVHPDVAVREIDQVPATVLRFISSSSRGGRMMADQWKQSSTLTVKRQVPFIAESGKTPPIRVMPR